MNKPRNGRRRGADVPASPVRAGQRVSLCMIARDEAQFIGDALDSVALLVDELIVVDTGSSDDTPDIARNHGARVFSFEWAGCFSDARNESLRHATGDWILILDADERIAPEGVEQIRRLVKAGRKRAYTFSQWTYLHDSAVIGWKKNPGGYEPARDCSGYLEARQVRLWPRRAGIRYRNVVHESVERSCERERLNVVSAPVTVHHFGRVRHGDSSIRKSRLYLELGLKKIKSGTSNPEAAYELAVQLMELGYTEKAREALNWLLERKPSHRDGLNAMSKVLRRLGQMEQAIETATRLVGLYPKFSDGWNTLGTLRVSTDVEAARDCFLKAVAAAPDNANALANLAMSYSGLKQFQDARRYLKVAQETNPTAARYSLLYIRILLEEGELPDAARCLRAVPTCDLRYAAADVLQLTELSIMLGLMGELEGHIRELLPVAADDRAIGLETALNLELNEFAEAAGHLYRLLVERHPDLGPAHNAVGCMLAREDRFDEALVNFASAVRSDPGNPGYLRNVALACEKLGLTRQALRCYQALVELDPSQAVYARERLENLETTIVGPAGPAG